MKEKLKSYPFEGMNDQQIFVINKLTKFRAARELEKQVGNLIHKDVKSEWYYAGYKDTGYMGGDHCSKGHSLRYVHFAKNRETGEEIKFGIKCVSDFFNITEDQLKLLKDGFVQTNKMVDQIIERFRAGNYKFDIITKKFLAVHDKVNNMEAIANLLYVYLPLPQSYEIEICNAYEKHENQVEFQKFLDENPKYAGIVVMAKLCKDSYLEQHHPKITAKIDEIFKYLDNHGKLTQAQIDLLGKLSITDYTETDKLFKELDTVPSEKFKKFNGYDEYQVYLSLKDSYKNYGLSEKQNNLLNKIYGKFKNTINLMQLPEIV
jgi:hypothetical protein